MIWLILYLVGYIATNVFLWHKSDMRYVSFVAILVVSLAWPSLVAGWIYQAIRK